MKTRKRKLFNTLYSVLIIALLVGIQSCESFFYCVEGDGNLVSESIGVRSFSGIENSTNIDVIVEYGRETAVIVEADENLQDYIIIKESGGDLSIETEMDRCLSSENSTTIFITCPTLELLELRGSGNVDVQGFDPDELNIKVSGSGDVYVSDLLANVVDVDISGSGDVKLDGKANEAYYNVSGSGDIRAKSFKLSECDVRVSGSGDIYAFAYDLMDIYISGSGDVYYYGDPTPTEVNQRTPGSGNAYER